MLRKLFVVVVVCVSVVGVQSAFADADLTLSFDRISSNSPIDVASQLSLEVMDLGGGQVEFKFVNAGGYSAAIADVYFGQSSSSLLNYSTATVPTDWGAGANPSHLPGLPPASFPVAFSADSDAPVAQNGIQGGQSGIFRINLANGVSFAQLSGALQGGDLQIGIHVQRLPNNANGTGTNESDSFLTVPVTSVVPVPAALYLGLGGMGLVALIRRRSDR